MIITIKFGSYNGYRYSKPWIAKVEFDSIGKTSMIWGHYVGDADDGGVVAIEAQVGDIIAYGQKDYKRMHRSGSTWAQVLNDKGELQELTKVEAFERFNINKKG